jgi:hypothetical protein
VASRAAKEIAQNPNIDRFMDRPEKTTSNRAPHFGSQPDIESKLGEGTIQQKYTMR